MDVIPDDNSYRLRSIMANDSVTLQFVSTEAEKIPIGSYIDYMGGRYTLYKPVKVTKVSTRSYSYIANFTGVIDLLKKYMYKFLSSIPFELKFTLTAKPIVFLQLLVDNLNLHDSGWSVGSCVDMTEIVLSFNHNSCYDVLNTLADKCKTEWSFEEKKLSLCKLEKFKEDPLLLTYGLGNGLKPGIQKQPAKDVLPPTVLYVQGGDRNISFSKYGSKYLKLPISQELTYNGRKYVTDKDGMFITRSDRPLADVVEASFDGSEYYPKRIGTVSKVETSVVDGQTVYDIIDSSIPASLDFGGFVMDAETMTIIFQTGALTGKEFDVQYVHVDRRFKIVSQNSDDMLIPGTIPFIPAVGDTYAVFHINLPNDYICNNTTQSGASWDMFREAARVLYESEDIEYSFKGSLDGLLTKKNWLSIGGKIVPGGYIQFTDKDIQEEPILIRIRSVKDYLTRPYSPEVELSNKTIAPSVNSEFDRIDQNEVNNENKHKEAQSFTLRRWRDAIAMQGMLEKAFKDYGKGQAMSWLRTMSVLVGHESLQFRFVDRIATEADLSVNEIDHTFNYDQAKKVFSTPSGIIQHMTIDIDSLAPSHKATEYRYWSVAAYTSPYLDDTEAMYLYIRCSRSDRTGSFLLSKEPHDLEEGNYYYFLCGGLTDEIDGQRSFATLYGFSEIGPGWMRLNKIINIDGTQYWDMLSKAFRIGDENAFLSYDQQKGLMLKGSIYQSPSGEIDYPEVDRGAYSDKLVYYPGDKVSYDGNVYKCTSQTTPGIDPTNTRYWKKLVAKGTNSFKSTVFIRTNATPSAPVGGSYASPLPTTAGWSDGIPSGEAILWASTRIFSSDGKDPQQTVWTAPRQMTDTADFDVEFSSVANPSAPNGHPNTNAQWSNTQSTDTIWMATSTKRNGVWSAWSVSRIKGEKGDRGWDGTDGEDGKDGDPGPRGDRGPRCTYRGDYDSSATYNGSSLITDIVSIKNSDGTRTYYVAKVDDNEPTFIDVSPTAWNGSAYWDTFGTNFSSVATDLLMARKIAASEIDVNEILANLARIGNFTITNGSLSVDTSVSDRTQITFPNMLTIGKTTQYAGQFGNRSSWGGVFFEGYGPYFYDMGVEKVLYREGTGVVFNAPGGRYPFLGVRIDNGNGIYGWNSPGNIANLYINKDAASTAHVYITNYQGLTSSDIRLKNVFFDIPGVLDKLEGISAFYYTMKEDEDKIPRIGVSAQAVREVLPEAVQLITPDNGDSYYGVDYIQMLTAFGINGIKELHAKVKALEKRVEELENR